MSWGVDAVRHPALSAGREAAPRYRRRRSDVFRLDGVCSMLFLTIASTLLTGLSPVGGGHPEKNTPKALSRARRPPPPGRTQADAGGWTLGGQVEPVAAGSGTAKGVVSVAGIVRSDSQPMTDAETQRLRYETTAREHGRVGCGWLLFEYRQRRQAPDTSSQRDGAVDCRTAGWPLFAATACSSRFRLLVSLCRNL